MLNFISVFLFVFVFNPIKIQKHDFHTSIAEINYNPKNNVWEVSLRIFTDDLENILSKKNKEEIRIEKNEKKYDVLIQKYVKENFELIHKKQKANFKWIAKEVEADVVWVYFELKFDKKLLKFELKNNILLELFDDQLNLNNFKYEKIKKTFITQKNTHSHQITF